MSGKWEKKARETLSTFHGVGQAVHEAVAAALEAAYEEGRAAPHAAGAAASEPEGDEPPGQG